MHTISTADYAQYKRLVCGRKNDIVKLFEHIAHGDSVALVGERRIGKSSLLYVTRDIINGQIAEYSTDLLDIELRESIDTLRTLLPNRKAIYLDLLALETSNQESLLKFLLQKFHDTGILRPFDDVTRSKGLPELFEAVNELLGELLQLVILIDEAEQLLEFGESRQLFKNLRYVCQSFPRVRFVLAGAESWHRQIIEKTTPFFNAVQIFYLKAPCRLPIEKYLIKRPLRTYFSESDDIDAVTQTIIDLTACKPYYTQAVCMAVIETFKSGKKLPEHWLSLVQSRVYDMIGQVLTTYYIDENLDTLSRKILALLANKPRLTTKEIADILGYSRKTVQNAIAELKALDKVHDDGTRYFIAGTLIEQWGKKTQEVPQARSSLPRRLKLCAAFILLLLAVWIYFYVHPDSRIFSFNFPDGVISVRMPRSLEPDEKGTAQLSVQNTKLTTINSLAVSLASSSVDFQKDGTNRIVFDSIMGGETKFWEPDFTARSQLYEDTLISQVMVFPDTSKPQLTYSFNVSKRILPIKKYWGLISVVCVAISGLFAGRDLTDLVLKLLSTLLRSKEQNLS